MKKTSGVTSTPRKKPGKRAQAKTATWSVEKLTVLRRPPSLASGANCDCNCGGK